MRTGTTLVVGLLLTSALSLQTTLSGAQKFDMCPDGVTPPHTCPCGGFTCGDCPSCPQNDSGGGTGSAGGVSRPDRSGQLQAAELQQARQLQMMQQSMQFGAEIGAQIGANIRHWLDRQAELGREAQALEKRKEFVRSLRQSVVDQRAQLLSIGNARLQYCNMLSAKAQRLGASSKYGECSKHCPQLDPLAYETPPEIQNEPAALDVQQTAFFADLHMYEKIGDSLDHECKIAILRLGNAVRELKNAGNVFDPSQFSKHLDQLDEKGASPKDDTSKLRRLEEENKQLKNTLKLQEENRRLKEQISVLEQQKEKKGHLDGNVFDPSKFSKHLDELSGAKNGPTGQGGN